MNKLSIPLVFLFCGFLLSACSSTNNRATFIPQAAETDQATVYIYRPNQMTNALYSPGLLINGEFKLYAKNALSSRVLLMPGEYVVEFQNEKKYSELTPLTLILKAGSVYFVRVSTSLKINDTAQYKPYARDFTLSQIDQPLAVKEIAECCMNNKNELTDKKKEPLNEQESGGGFSVDKTQNPFSH